MQHPEQMPQPLALADLLPLAEAASRLLHPFICAPLDYGETDDAVYLVLPFLGGGCLADDLMRTRTVDVARTARIAAQVATALDYATRQGVIHRDVKPDNVILEGERVRLIDFGAALLTVDYYEQPHLRDVTAVGKRWRTAQVEWIGNAAYMCPQWMNEGKVSPATDVFSVCVVLYEMITGRPLYAREVYRHREIRAEEFAPELGPLVAELRRGVSRARSTWEASTTTGRRSCPRASTPWPRGNVPASSGLSPRRTGAVPSRRRLPTAPARSPGAPCTACSASSSTTRDGRAPTTTGMSCPAVCGRSSCSSRSRWSPEG